MPKKTESLMAILLILLHICNTLPISDTTYGVYRIDRVPKEGLAWIKTQLFNPNPARDTADDYATKMFHLTKVSLPIFTKVDGQLQTISSTIKNTPYFQFGIMGVNFDVQKQLPTGIDKATIDGLFPTNTLFLFVSKSDSMVAFSDAYTNIPAKFWSIDYESVKPPDAIAVTAITSPKGDQKINEWIDINKNLACNHSNLVLGIFFLLDSRLSASDSKDISPATGSKATSGSKAPASGSRAKPSVPPESDSTTTPPKSNSKATPSASVSTAMPSTSDSTTIPPAPSLQAAKSTPLPYKKVARNPADDPTIDEVLTF